METARFGGTDGNAEPHEAVCLGESMVLFVPSGDGPAHEVDTWHRTIGGAESNVACHLAEGGMRTRWVSALGADPFGSVVLDRLGRFGIELDDVRIDRRRPTGVYFKAPGHTGSRVWYNRTDSAAAAMGPELLESLELERTRLLHLTGITPALSSSCRELVDAALDLPRGDMLVSLDVNWRSLLWSARGAEGVDDPAELLRAFADRADVVLVGDDEAAEVWGSRSVSEIRELLPHPRSLVIKHGSAGATLVEDGTELFEPALSVEVVEPVGAGDAFAAGVLASTLAGDEPRHRLRSGHLKAAAVLCTTDDVGPPLPEADVSRMLAADEREWSSVTIREGEVIG